MRRILQMVLVAAIAMTAMGALPNNDKRFNDLGHKMMCICGCGQVLLECNHVGCPDSDRMRLELAAQMKDGLGDRPIFNWFVEKYGPTVLAAPMRGGFDNVAWIAPFAVFLLAIFGTVLLVRKWRVRTVAAPSSAASAPYDAMRERIRKETEY